METEELWLQYHFVFSLWVHNPQPVTYGWNSTVFYNRFIDATPPIFQQLCLVHLPFELIHYIMRLSHPNDARRLGSTCRMLREISLSYIYTVRLHSHTRSQPNYLKIMPIDLSSPSWKYCINTEEYSRWLYPTTPYFNVGRYRLCIIKITHTPQDPTSWDLRWLGLWPSLFAFPEGHTIRDRWFL